MNRKANLDIQNNVMMKRQKKNTNSKRKIKIIDKTDFKTREIPELKYIPEENIKKLLTLIMKYF